ncbi:ComEC/Rec2 family competence protein, partial [Thermodesulfobacteriota bacterium]
WHDDLKVTIIDVGQGTSALLEIPGGDCLLIDGGGFSDNSIFDVGARIIAPLLWRKKIKTVDTLILSHPNSDHLNGLTYIAQHFNVKSVWSNTEEASTLSYQKFWQTIKQKKIALPGLDDISGPHNMNGVTLKVLYPPKDFIERAETERWRSANNNSLVIKVEFGSTSVLFPGDLKKRAEKELVALAGDDLDSAVLISPHHGSKTSSTGSFLDRVKPELVIISSGWKNRFSFPHASVLKRYRRRGYRIFRTDKHGAMVLSTDGQTLTVRPTIIDDES